jgi:predicted ATPase
MLALLAKDHVAFGEWVGQMVAIAIEQSFDFWRAYGTICRGWIKVTSGDVTQGVSLLRSGLAAYRATGGETYMPHHIALLARACEIAEQIEEGLSLLDEAREIAEITGERWFAAELNRHKGRLLLQQGHAQAAEELYRKALSIAEEQKAKLWELRAAMSLARLCRDQGRRSDARDLLAPVCGWFTEGFDIPDLKQAKALLHELA